MNLYNCLFKNVEHQAFDIDNKFLLVADLVCRWEDAGEHATQYLQDPLLVCQGWNIYRHGEDHCLP